VANDICDPQDKSKALSNIALAIASTDVEKAEELLEEAIAVSNKKDPYYESDALSSIAEAIASTDTKKAEELLDKALSLANDIDYSAYKSRALSSIAQAIASIDIDKAVSTANTIDDPQYKSMALSGIAQAIASTYMEKAEELLDEAVSLADEIDSPSHEDYRLSAIAKLVIDSRLNSLRITSIIDMMKDKDQLYEIALYSIAVPDQVWINIIKQLTNYPEIFYLICSLICIRNLKQSKDIVKIMINYTF
jgi:tetratricopeptide (TPR) repeat protein